MGMFDDVRCDYPIPELPGQPPYRFQTKDFECNLDTYIITADGRLQLRAWDWEANERNEKEPYHAPTDKAFHGDLWFYGFVNDKQSEGWVDCTARFTEGQLVSIKCDVKPR